jgi:predicted NAD/FAD-binding protein
LLNDIAVEWVGMKSGVYSYIKKILAQFKGEILLNADIDYISRNADILKIKRSHVEVQEFDKSALQHKYFLSFQFFYLFN